MTEFIQERELAKRFYDDAVAPVLLGEMPGLSCSVALLGDGSGVLGYDTPMSRDHDWGPRLQIFVDASMAAAAAEIESLLERRLPDAFGGYQVRFSKNGSPVVHHVEVAAISSLLSATLGISSAADLGPADWLTFPQQKLLALTSGIVLRDDDGSLASLRARLAYYPRDVWLYLLASGWRQISQEMPFVGRCAAVGDEIGSRTVAARQCSRVISLAFLVERRFAPYNKWLGTAFKQLKLGAALAGPIHRALSAAGARSRERYLAESYLGLVTAFNDLALLPPVLVRAESFYDRPYLVVNGPDPEQIRLLIGDAFLRALPVGVGSADQVTDNVDVLERAGVFRELGGLYSALARRPPDGC